MSPTEPPPMARQHCRHYSYEPGAGPRCALGLDLSAPGAGRCCWPDPKVECASRENWSDQEKATWQAWRDQRTQQMIAAIAALPQLDGRSKAVIDCPTCSGKITYIRIPTRAYVECETPYCVKFEANVRGLWPGKNWRIRMAIGETQRAALNATLGRRVSKTSGDYQFDGEIRAWLIKRSGAVRYVVEDDRGLLLIMNAAQCGLDGR